MPNPPHEMLLQDTPALEDWSTAMPYPTGTLLPRSRFARENFAEGIAESVLQVLDHCGIELTATAREHISTCTDMDLARTWLDEALTANDQSSLTGLDAI